MALAFAKSPAVVGQKITDAGDYDGNHIGQHVVHAVRQPKRQHVLQTYAEPGSQRVLG